MARLEIDVRSPAALAEVLYYAYSRAMTRHYPDRQALSWEDMHDTGLSKIWITMAHEMIRASMMAAR